MHKHRDRLRELFPNTLCDTLFIDPGIMGTGWSFYPMLTPELGRDFTSLGHKTPNAFLSSGVLNTLVSGTWDERAYSIIEQVETILDLYTVSNVVVEFPELYNSAKGHTSAEKGDLFKLSYLIGGMTHIIKRRGLQNTIFLSPSEWKGQLPKDVVIRRLQTLYPHNDFNNHMADAVGMAVAVMGLLTLGVK